MEKEPEFSTGSTPTRVRYSSLSEIQVESVNHHLVGESSPPPFYTIREVVQFEVVIKEKINGEWVPFNGKDVQVPI